MRYLILSDIHSNLEALESAFAEALRSGPIAEVWCAGDIVGYGPNPNECIDLLREFSLVCVLGNHDAAAIGSVDTEGFNLDAAAACHWTSHELTITNKSFLKALPETRLTHEFTLAHGSPRFPLWEYLYAERRASKSLDHFKTPFCIVGHTHIPALFRFDPTSGRGALEPLASLLPLVQTGEKLIINPGSIGQPRDGDPRASFAIYDNELATIEHHRIRYDIALSQSKMLANGLPPRLATRLSDGL